MQFGASLSRISSGVLSLFTFCHHVQTNDLILENASTNCTADSVNCGDKSDDVKAFLNLNSLIQDRAMKAENRLSATTTLTVNVVDSDDQDPTFEHDVYTSKVRTKAVDPICLAGFGQRLP